MDLASHTTHVGRGPTLIQSPPGFSPGTARALAKQLSAFDRWLLEMLYQHRVFTTRQLADLAFDTLSGARHHLHRLHQDALLARFRPLGVTGSAPWHYVLGPGGTAVLAAR